MRLMNAKESCLRPAKNESGDYGCAPAAFGNGARAFKRPGVAILVGRSARQAEYRADSKLGRRWPPVFSGRIVVQNRLDGKRFADRIGESAEARRHMNQAVEGVLTCSFPEKVPDKAPPTTLIERFNGEIRLEIPAVTVEWAALDEALDDNL